MHVKNKTIPTRLNRANNTESRVDYNITDCSHITDCSLQVFTQKFTAALSQNAPLEKCFIRNDKIFYVQKVKTNDDQSNKIFER